MDPWWINRGGTTDHGDYRGFHGKRRIIRQRDIGKISMGYVLKNSEFSLELVLFGITEWKLRVLTI